jgi:hypothetical protein
MASKNRIKNTVSEVETNLTASEVSREEKVARLTAKQAIIVALITGLLGTISLITVAILNKPVSLPNEKTNNEKTNAEVQYFQPTIDSSVKQLNDNKNELFKLQTVIAKLISKEKDAESLKQLEEAQEEIKTAFEVNEKARVNFAEYANKSIEALQKGNGVEAAVLRKQANEEGEREFDAISKVSQAIENLNKNIKYFRIRPVRPQIGERWQRRQIKNPFLNIPAAEMRAGSPK